ncbi:hypothetical protein QBC36DRAFT_371844 [Triangularia setosa]|uniref:Uncharacterized protein n=1 Tax=Triangularia setosa TaxID=2587417 RepID=A0AAN6WB65_9PEZI|nr:hypothetical protein QBC36DRAFT_371844 [Podospora setosa]
MARMSLTPAGEARLVEVHTSQVSKGGVPAGMTSVFSINQGIQPGKGGLSRSNTGMQAVGKGVSVMESGIRGTLQREPKLQEAVTEEQQHTPKMITLRRPSKTSSSERESTPTLKIVVLRRPSKVPPERETDAEPTKKKTIIKLRSPAKKSPSTEVESILGPLRPCLLPPSRTKPPPHLTQASPATDASTGPAHSYGLRSRRARLLQS